MLLAEVAEIVAPLTRKKIQQIRDIAIAARAWAVTRKVRGRQLDDLYGEDLEGLCAVANGKLFTELKRAGFDAQLACNPSHCFVLVNDNIVVDITATQFRDIKPEWKVIIDTLDNARRFDKELYTPQPKFHDTESLRIHQKKQGWSKRQWVRN